MKASVWRERLGGGRRLGEVRGAAPVLGAMAVALAPHAMHLPLWVTFWCLAAWGWVLAGQALVEGRLRRWIPARPERWPMPGGLVRQLLGLGGCLLVGLGYGQFFGRDPGVAMLAVMMGLKPLELRTHKDRMVAVFLSYFMVVANLFYDESLEMAAYMAFAVWACQWALAHAARLRGQEAAERGMALPTLTASPFHTQTPAQAPARLAALTLVWSLPLVAVLFVLFPRLPSGFLGLTAPVRVAGFNDHLDMGDLTELATSDAVAFRARFEGGVPPQGDLYWRGLVLWRYGRGRWRKGPSPPYRTRPISGSGETAYTVILEPHLRSWLFALDLPLFAPDLAVSGTHRGAKLMADDTVVLEGYLTDRLRYALRSLTRVERTRGLRPWEARALELPAEGDPQSRALAQGWRDQAPRPQDVLDRALAFFREGGFVYTLSPPALDRTAPHDSFLFETRAGYCGHYASAMAFLMRAAGLPARVVVGFQGGVVNDLGGFLAVRQADAHAWCEVWLDGKGWVRVDPTAQVAPERIARGADAALPEDPVSGLFDGTRVGPWLERVGVLWDSVNFHWYETVMDYDFQRQQGLLGRVGLRMGTLLGTLGALAAGAVLAAILGAALYGWLFRLRRPPGAADKALVLYRRFAARLEPLGLAPHPGEGPLDHADRVAAARPDLGATVRDLAWLYTRLRYARPASGAAARGGEEKEQIKELSRRARRFRPGEQHGRSVT